MNVLIVSLVLKAMSSVIVAEIKDQNDVRPYFKSVTKKENEDINNVFVSRHISIGKPIFPNTIVRLSKASKPHMAPKIPAVALPYYEDVKPVNENALETNENHKSAAVNMKTQNSNYVSHLFDNLKSISNEPGRAGSNEPVIAKGSLDRPYVIKKKLKTPLLNYNIPVEETKTSGNRLRYNEDAIPKYSYQSLKQSSDTRNQAYYSNEDHMKNNHKLKVKLIPKAIIPNTRATKRFYIVKPTKYLTEVRNVQFDSQLTQGLNDVAEAPQMLNSWGT